MRLIIIALIPIFGFVATSAADTVSLIIPLTKGQPAASGFRDIAPGLHAYEITIQATTSAFLTSSISSTSGGVTWIPQNNTMGKTTHRWLSATQGAEGWVGTVSGTGFFMEYMNPGQNPQQHVSPFRTSNAVFADVIVEGGEVLEAGISTETTAPDAPTTIPAAHAAGRTVPSFLIQGFQDGYVWFTSDSPISVYYLAPGAQSWVKLNQQYFIAANGSTTFPPTGAKLQMRTTGQFASTAQLKLRFKSSISVNGGADGDTIDILEVDWCDFANPPKSE